MLAPETRTQRSLFERVVQRHGLAEKVVQRDHVAAHDLSARKSKISDTFPPIESGKAVRQLIDMSVPLLKQAHGTTLVQQPYYFTEIYGNDGFLGKIQALPNTHTTKKHSHRKGLYTISSNLLTPTECKNKYTSVNSRVCALASITSDQLKSSFLASVAAFPSLAAAVKNRSSVEYIGGDNRSKAVPRIHTMHRNHRKHQTFIPWLEVLPQNERTPVNVKQTELE